jgi:hypothetical protein
MRVRFLFLFVTLTLLVSPFWFAQTAHAQYEYYCETPDGEHYWSHNPCDYKGWRNEDAAKGYPYNFHQNTFHGTPLQDPYPAIVDGAKQMMQGNEKIMAKMSEKGMKDPELTTAEKMMTDGYDMIMKAQEKLATNKTEAQKMLSKGGKMMMDAHKKIAAEVEKKGMTQTCYDDFAQCSLGEKKIKEGGLHWFFGSPGL